MAGIHAEANGATDNLRICPVLKLQQMWQQLTINSVMPMIHTHRTWREMPELVLSSQALWATVRQFV